MAPRNRKVSRRRRLQGRVLAKAWRTCCKVRTMKILIVEDDLEAAAYLSKAFREAGIVLDHASDGESGLFLATENSYDVLVIDGMLARRDGLSLISELRRRNIHTPVLILSALGQVDDRVTGLRA